MMCCPFEETGTNTVPWVVVTNAVNLTCILTLFCYHENSRSRLVQVSRMIPISYGRRPQLIFNTFIIKLRGL